MHAFYKLCFSLLVSATISTALFAQMRKPEQEPFIPGELIVQIDRNADLYQLVASLPPQYTFRVVSELSPFMRAWLVDFNEQILGQTQALALIRTLPGITIAQNNHAVTLREVPNDPQFNQQWHHLNNGSNNGTPDADIDSDEAWEITTGGTNALGHDIVVCILEGVDFSHVDLIENRWTNTAEIPGNGIDDDANGYIDDLFGWNVGSNSGNLNGAATSHGTNVAGMIGAKGNNAVGVVGANWNVKMCNVQGYNINTEASVISAYNYPLTLRKRYNQTNGAEGAFVVATNASWGIDEANPNNYPLWCGFYDTLGVHGILNCGATTNNNLNVDLTGDMPTACSSPYMVGVGRSDRNDNFAGGYGLTTINFAAPGINVRTTANGNAYTTTTGTSFASPLTAGVIALLYAIPCVNFMNAVLDDPQLGSDAVLNALMSGVDQKPQLANFFVAGGRVNSKKSMDILMLETCNSCATPAQLSSSNIIENATTINFNLVNDATSYTLFYRIVGASNWSQMSVSSNPLQLTGLSECTTYEYYMQAICPQENSNNSAIFTFLTKGCGACIDLDYCSNTTTTTPGPKFEIQTPSNLSATLSNYTQTAGWGGSLETAYAYGNLVLVNDGTASPELGCNALVNNAAILGNIAVAVRGTCPFSTKAMAAQNAGATALVIINNQVQGPATLAAANDAANVTIPVVMISQAQGAQLLTALQNGGTAMGFLGRQKEWIESIEISGDLFITGDNNGYTGPIDTQIELLNGNTYPVLLTPGFAGQPLLEYSRIWLDGNQNGQFESNELVFDQGAASLGAISAPLTVPLSAMAGLTRIRVQMVYQGFGAAALPTNCGLYTYGETEDYCVLISSNASLSHLNNLALSMYPNPSSGTIYFTSNSMEQIRIQIISSSGQVVKQKLIFDTTATMDLNNLASGVYTVHASSASGAVLQVQQLVLIK